MKKSNYLIDTFYLDKTAEFGEHYISEKWRCCSLKDLKKLLGRILDIQIDKKTGCPKKPDLDCNRLKKYYSIYEKLITAIQTKDRADYKIDSNYMISVININI